MMNQLILGFLLMAVGTLAVIIQSMDYEILCRYCQNCTSYQNKYGVNSEQYKEWYQTHTQSCPINYIGSSNGYKDNMRKAVWASLMHCLSTDQDPQP